MKKRIIKRTYPNGTIRFVFQKKAWFGWTDSGSRFTRCAFETLEEARRNEHKFIGTKIIEEEVLTYD